MNYLLFLVAPIMLSMWAAWKTKTTFTKFSKVPVSTGLTGAEAAQRLLSGAGIGDVEIVPARGHLSDHYNPKTKKLALSESVYQSRSVAAVGVACHEAGHAIQHASNYAPLWLRSALVPTASIGSRFGFMAIMAGMFMASRGLVLIGVLGFAAVFLFQLVTLPVEFNASKRAKALAERYGIVRGEEATGMSKVLNAAALTYVAAMLTSLGYLLVYLPMLLGGRRNA